MMLIVCVLLVIVMTMLGVSIVFNVRHARLILEMEEAVTEALDVCDRAHIRMEEILELPVAFITPEVRQVIRYIEDTRAAVLYVSNVLAGPYGGVEIDDTEDDA